MKAGKITAFCYAQTPVAQPKILWRKYMRKALVTGGNTKFGRSLVDYLRIKFEVTLIKREDLINGDVDKYEGAYDLVIFNHNTMPTNIDAETIQRDCLVCQDILQWASDPSCDFKQKVVWMLSSGIGGKSMPNLMPYWMCKSINLHIMRYYAYLYDEIYIGIDPERLVESNYPQQAVSMINLLERDDLESGKVYKLNGSVSGL